MRRRAFQAVERDVQRSRVWGSSWGVHGAEIQSVWKEREEQGRELKIRLAKGQGQSGKALLATAKCLNCVLSTVGSL